MKDTIWLDMRSTIGRVEVQCGLTGLLSPEEIGSLYRALNGAKKGQDINFGMQEVDGQWVIQFVIGAKQPETVN